MTTATEEEVSASKTDDPENVAHYVKKRDLGSTSQEVEALCGYKFIPKRLPQDFPICQPCSAVFEDDEARRLAAQ